MRLLSEESTAIGCKALDPKYSGVLSQERVGILKLLSAKDMYPAEIAREMGIEVQAVYYHVKLLEKAGLISFAHYEEKQGGIAKRFSLASDSFAIVINERAWKKMPSVEKQPPKLFAPFINNGFFEGKFVVGSPDPHGKYRARGSEFAMVELAMFLGNYASFSYPLYLLDTQLKESDRKQNLIVAGGPKVNMLAAEISPSMKMRFEINTSDVYSTLSKKRYNGNIGVVELLENPFNPDRKMLFLGGLNHFGTRAAVLGILEKIGKIEEGNASSRKHIARVVEGFDEDGDGIVDSVEILE